MSNEVHRDVLPSDSHYDSHVTAMEAIKGEFGLKAGATTAPSLLKVFCLAFLITASYMDSFL